MDFVCLFFVFLLMATFLSFTFLSFTCIILLRDFKMLWLYSFCASTVAPDGKKRIGLKTIFTDLDVGAKTVIRAAYTFNYLSSFIH